MGELVKVSDQRLSLSPDEIALIKKTFAPGLTQTEFELFVYTAQSVGLNPLKRQIYAVKRKQYDPETGQYEHRMTIQTGIDGFRAVSFRNEKTIPGHEPTFVYGEKSTINPIGLVSATAYLKVWGEDKQYHEVSATAYWDEYVPLNKHGKPQAMWGKMPRTMLAKCAEALLHRKCNPEDLSGVYSTEEMAQADAEKRAIEVLPEPEVDRGSYIKEAMPNQGEKTGTAYAVVVPEQEPEPVGRDPLGDATSAVKTAEEIFPGATVVSKTGKDKKPRKGKFGFLDEMERLKAILNDDKLYYELLSTVGPGNYTKANQIDDREHQVAFWRVVKSAIAMKYGEEGQKDGK